MPRPQFTLRALLVAIFGVCCFLGGTEFGARRERERLALRRANVKVAEKQLERDFEMIQQFSEQQRRVEADWLERHLDEAR